MFDLIIFVCIIIRFIYSVFIQTYFRQSNNEMCYDWLARHYIQSINKTNYYMNYGLWDDSQCMNLKMANQNLAKFVLEKACIKSCAKVLDVGCGYGEQDMFWINLLPKGSQIVAVDLSQYQILSALQRNKNAAIQFETGNAMEIDKQYQNQTFDVIFSLESAFHYNDRPRFFRNVSKCLKPKSGLFIITDLVVKRHNNVITKTVLKLFADVLNIPAQNRITSDEWIQQLKAANLEVKEVIDLTDKTFRPYYTSFMKEYFVLNPELGARFANFLCTFQPFEYKVAVCSTT